MKRSSKHKFAHQDPEKNPEPQQKINSTTNNSDDFSLIKKDLRRTTITIAVFIIIVIVLYVIKIRTDWFTILLTKIGL